MQSELLFSHPSVFIIRISCNLSHSLAGSGTVQGPIVPFLQGDDILLHRYGARRFSGTD